jgi:hypothetical protein
MMMGDELSQSKGLLRWTEVYGENLVKTLVKKTVKMVVEVL